MLYFYYAEREQVQAHKVRLNVNAKGIDNVNSKRSHVAQAQVVPRGLRRVDIVKGENGKPAPMSETESSLSRFTANAAGVQSHEVGLKLKAED